MKWLLPLPDDSLLILGLPVRTILDEAAVSLGDKPLPAPAWHLLDDVIIDDSGLETEKVNLQMAREAYAC